MAPEQPHLDGRTKRIGSNFRGRFEEQLRQRHDAEMQRLQAEEDEVMDCEREAQEARLKEKQVEMILITAILKVEPLLVGLGETWLMRRGDAD